MQVKSRHLITDQWGGRVKAFSGSSNGSQENVWGGSCGWEQDGWTSWQMWVQWLSSSPPLCPCDMFTSTVPSAEPEHACMLSHLRLFVTPWTVARQAPLSMGFSSKNTEVGSHSLFQGIFSNPGIECWSPALQASSFLSEYPGKPWNNSLTSPNLHTFGKGKYVKIK